MGRPAIHHDRIANFCRTEPSFTLFYVAWSLKVDDQTVRRSIKKLLDQRKIVQIEPASGRFGATYRWLTRKERQQGLRLVVRPIKTPEHELARNELVYTTQAPAEVKQ